MDNEKELTHALLIGVISNDLERHLSDLAIFFFVKRTVLAYAQ